MLSSLGTGISFMINALLERAMSEIKTSHGYVKDEVNHNAECTWPSLPHEPGLLYRP